jgi:type IV pilus assembly protein PilA
MFCFQCGAAIPDASRFCDHCGQPVGQPIPASSVPPGVAVPAFTPPAPGAPTSGKALASMITGIFGLLFFPIAFAAIILGHISRSEIRKSNGQLKGDGMATAGLVMGYGAFAIIPFILIIAAIAIPNLLRARIAANEASAVANIRTLNTAEMAYQREYSTIGFACSLSVLGGDGRSAPSADHAQLIDHVLVLGQKHGYRFVVENCVNTETDHKYQVVAYPLVRHQTGVRTFCSDETNIIKAGEGESAADCLANGSPLD